MITNYTNWLVVIPLAEGYFTITKYFKCSTFSFFHVDGLENGQLSVLFLSSSTSAAKNFLDQSQPRIVELKKLSKYKMGFEFSFNTSVSSFTTRSPGGPSFESLFPV